MIVLDLTTLPFPQKAHPKALEMVEFMQRIHADIRRNIEANNAKHMKKKVYAIGLC
jgi:hypothetical protein